MSAPDNRDGVINRLFEWSRRIHTYVRHPQSINDKITDARSHGVWASGAWESMYLSPQSTPLFGRTYLGTYVPT